jgi:hypothetical protein
MERSSSSSSSSSSPSFFTSVLCCMRALFSALHCTSQCRSRCLCQRSLLLFLLLRKWSFSSSHSLLSVANSLSHY